MKDKISRIKGGDHEGGSREIYIENGLKMLEIKGLSARKLCLTYIWLYCRIRRIFDNFSL